MVEVFPTDFDVDSATLESTFIVVLTAKGLGIILLCHFVVIASLIHEIRVGCKFFEVIISFESLNKMEFIDDE